MLSFIVMAPLQKNEQSKVIEEEAVSVRGKAITDVESPPLTKRL